ncbi:MAG: hypothetical protein ABI193_21350, partial [Minicystis sp.]
MWCSRCACFRDPASCTGVTPVPAGFWSVPEAVTPTSTVSSRGSARMLCTMADPPGEGGARLVARRSQR